MDEMEWARTTVTVFDAEGEALANVESPGDRLVEQLAATEAWLRSGGHEAYDGWHSVRVLCSWMPPAGQHAMTLVPSLVEALAQARGSFWLDAYPAGG